MWVKQGGTWVDVAPSDLNPQASDIVVSPTVNGADDVQEALTGAMFKADPQAANIDTSESTTSSAFSDLATVGPAVTLTTGTRALVFVQAWMWNSTAGGQCRMGFDVSGATTLAASVDYMLAAVSPTANGDFAGGAMFLLAGLTAGSNTFTLKYRTVGGTANFSRRRLAVVPL